MSITDEMKEEALKNGINIAALRARINKSGWPIEKAITEPLIKRKRRRDRYTGEYAVYKNDEIAAMGTAEECAKELESQLII